MNPLSIIDAMTDPALFGKQFKGTSWDAWKAFLKALYGLPMSEPSLATVRGCTGLEHAPTEPSREAFVIAGRRGGKSRIAALIAVYEAAFVDRTAQLAPGEVATVALLARDRKQARTLFRYVSALLKRPLVAQLVTRKTATEIELGGRTVIEVQTASMGSTRSYSFATVICDEMAFWPSSEDCAEPDREVLTAVRPGLATLRGKLICISTPYAMRGALYEAFRQSYGQAGPVLVWKAPTETMNPTMDPWVIEQELLRDPEAGRAEWLAEWRSDLEAYVSRELIDRAMMPGRNELPPQAGISYTAFCDPSGGRHDAMTLAIAHTEDGVVILDLLDVVSPPFSPDVVVKQFAATLDAYRLREVSGDRYAGEWPVERFSAHGITYTASERTKSELYQAFLPLLTSDAVRLLDHGQLRQELAGLERRTGRSGKDAITHRPGSHDDVANACVGAMLLAEAAIGTGALPVVRHRGDAEGARVPTVAELAVREGVAPDPFDAWGRSPTGRRGREEVWPVVDLPSSPLFGGGRRGDW